MSHHYVVHVKLRYNHVLKNKNKFKKIKNFNPVRKTEKETNPQGKYELN